MTHDDNYCQILGNIQKYGTDAAMRNATCRKVHGTLGRYDLRKGFPLLLHKKVHYTSSFDEMCWMQRGETNTGTLKSRIWDKWADENGDLGPVYGEQMVNQVFYKLAFTTKQQMKYAKAGYEYYGRVYLTKERMSETFGEEFDALLAEGKISADNLMNDGKGGAVMEFEVSIMRKHVNQLQRAVDQLKKVNETGIADRRVLISLWNNADYEMQALPPCHTIFHFLQMPMTTDERYEWYCDEFYYNNYDQYISHATELGESPAMALRDAAESEIHHAMSDIDGGHTQDFTTSEALDRLGVPKFRLDLALFMRKDCALAA